MRNKVFCLTPLARSNYDQIVEKLADPHFEVRPSRAVPIGKNWILEGRNNKEKLTEK